MVFFAGNHSVDPLLDITDFEELLEISILVHVGPMHLKHSGKTAVLL
jgi:hypothetical protein